MSAAPVHVVAKGNRILRRFAELNAIDSQSARSLEELNLRRSVLFLRLQRRGVIVSPTPDHYYLDAEMAARWQRFRRISMLISLSMVLLAWGVWMAWGQSGG